MSTAGKVLTVLVVLVAVVWVMLTATVAQLNRNGTQAVETLTKNVEKLQADVRSAARSLDALKEQTHLEQVKTQHDLTGLQVRLSDAEKVRAQVLETSARVKLQLADAEAILKAGQAQSEEWLAAKNAEIKAKADAEEGVKKMTAENQELLARLTSLRDKFRSTLRENKALVDRLMKAGDRATPRRASMAR